MTQQDLRPHLNFALVEDVRPRMYQAMKYWGKKPHNIWSQFIERYCPPGGTVLDPFAGSAVAAFEAMKLGRKAVAFDLNPLTSFMIEVTCSEFDITAFERAFAEIADAVEIDPVYIAHYKRTRDGQSATVSNYQWLDGQVFKVAAETETARVVGVRRAARLRRQVCAADDADRQLAASMSSLEIPYWYPDAAFPDTPTIKHKFILDLGGDGFRYLWTRRNLYLLSLIFDKIVGQQNANVRLQLLSGFLQTLHLASKMVVPRHEQSNREFSGSWGRADYMVRRRQMEQNPLVVFRRSCLEKQGVKSCLIDARSSLPSGLNVVDFNRARTIRAAADLTYGIVDVADLARYVQAKSVDFIITDPPYAGLVPYLELSLVWLVWLQRIDGKYVPDLQSEITIKRGHFGRDQYTRRLQNAFRQMHQVLKDDGYIVITFHHKKLREWNDFVQAVRLAGFKFDKVTHQYNKRSGESNVANPYGTSGADFYIRCVKRREVDFTDNASELRDFIVQKTIEIVSLRNEPTPYDFIIAGLLPEMLQAGYMQPQEYNQEILSVLSQNVGEGRVFTTWANTDTRAGDYWWFRNPGEFINYPDRPLQDRLEETIVSILRRRVSVKFDDILGELFRTYPNGLTPDPRGLTRVLEANAYRAAGFWKIKPATLVNITEHSDMIRRIVNVGTRAGYLVHVGRREQPESVTGGGTLGALATIPTLDVLREQYDPRQIERLAMVDVVWLRPQDSQIACMFEVENSTGFTSAIVRGSNAESQLPKFIVIPSARERELRAFRDPLFLDSFRDNSWRYTTYESMSRLEGYAAPSVAVLLDMAICL